MSRFLAGLLVVATTCSALPAEAQEADPRFWRLMPVLGPLIGCASVDPTMSRRALAAFEAAQANSGHILPGYVAPLLLSAHEHSQPQDMTPQESAQCEAVLAFYASPGFSVTLRQTLVSPMLFMSALQCIAQEEGDITRKALLGAYERNGFTLDPDTLDAAVLEAGTDANLHVAEIGSDECSGLADYLDSTQFDNDYSEESVRAMFADPQG